MRKFLLGLVAGLFLAAFAAFVLVLALARLGDRRPSISDGSTLVFKLEGDVPERPPVSVGIPWIEEQKPATVTDIWNLLRRASIDSRIKAMIFMPRGVGAGWGKLSEIRESLQKFRNSGKPLIVFLRNPRTPEYYLATAGERIYMTPEDLLDVKGLRAEISYFRKSLDKIGVEMEVEHAGKYKDAGDMFTRSSISPETREVINSILDRLYPHLLQTIASARKKSPEEVRAAIDEGPFLAEQARSKGLVDALMFEDQVFDEVTKKLGQKEIRKLSHRDYLRGTRDSSDLDGRTKIAVIVGEGAILRGEGRGAFGDEGIMSGSLIKLLRDVGKDDSIKGVILRIDSPGGDAIASDDILREAKLLSGKKPLVVSMSDVAASGGYYIAMTGDPVVAYSNTITGSIGVIYGKLNARGLFDKLGVTQETITRGRYANIDSITQPLDESGRKKLREGVDAVYKTFVSHVASARKQPYERVDQVAQGRVWLGSQAKEQALLDELGGLDRAIELVRRKAKIPDQEKTRLVIYPPEQSWFEYLLSRSSEQAMDVRLRMLLNRVGLDPVPWLEGGMMKLMPFSLRIN
jgi:protease-4